MNRPFVAANRSIDGLPRLRPRNPLQPRLLFNASRCYGLRQLHSSPAPRQQHLLWAGKLLDQTTSTFQPLSHSLILAAGAADDLDRGDITLLTPAASATRGHSLLPYRTAEPESLTRVLAIGRNTHAQLGLGFASQEATFGLVRPGFFGTGGISAILAGTSQSWMITTDQDSNQRFAFAWGGKSLMLPRQRKLARLALTSLIFFPLSPSQIIPRVSSVWVGPSVLVLRNQIFTRSRVRSRCPHKSAGGTMRMLSIQLP